jgi:hypothetical protein
VESKGKCLHVIFGQQMIMKVFMTNETSAIIVCENLYAVLSLFLQKFEGTSLRVTCSDRRILFFNFYFPKEKLLIIILFSLAKGVSFNAPNM